MEITKNNLSQTIGALRQCAKENKRLRLFQFN